MEDKIYEVTEIKTAETLAVKIRTTVRSTQKIMLDAAISIGQDLVDAKELVDHGEWKDWLENSVGFSYESAKKYMQISREYGDFSKRELITDLSYTKALKLLAVPEEDRKEFIQNNDIESITVKELEEKIKELKTENETMAEGYETIAKESSELVKTRDILESNLQELKDRIKELEESGGDQGPSEEVKQEIEQHMAALGKAEKDIEKSNQKIEKLQKEIEELKDSQEKAAEEAKASTVEEAKEAAKKELEEEMAKLMAIADDATKAKLEAEKKLQASASEDLMNFKFLVNELQGRFNDALASLDNIKTNDQEQSDKLRAGLKMILGKLAERL